MAVDTDFVALSQTDTEPTETPISVEVLPFAGIEDAKPTSADPVPQMRTYLLPASGVIEMLTDAKPFRRVATIIQFGTLITIQLSYQDRFDAPDFISMSSTNFDIPLFANQRLYARQATGVDQNVSIIIEPRGDER